jgi:predicted HTH domain antitoxin
MNLFKSIPKEGRTAVATVNVSIDLPREVLFEVRQDLETFVREMRLAAAVSLYEMEVVSEAKVAVIARLSRAEFLDALGCLQATPFQYGASDIGHGR